MKDLTELRNMNAEELNNELLSLRETQFNLRFKKANGSLDKTDKISIVRRSIAQVKTIMTEKAGV